MVGPDKGEESIPLWPGEEVGLEYGVDEEEFLLERTFIPLGVMSSYVIQAGVIVSSSIAFRRSLSERGSWRFRR